jgi:hypothetical protein
MLMLRDSTLWQSMLVGGGGVVSNEEWSAGAACWGGWEAV